jgi:hypothetical protein
LNDPRTASTLEALATRAGINPEERDWIKHLARVRATADVSKPMTEEEALTLLTSLVVEPTTGRELFTITLNRLRDVQYDLRHGEFSVRQIYNPPDRPVLEEPVQNLVAYALDQRHRRQYSVVREPELTRKARPDIRLLNARCGGPITIEIKIAERWTIAQLELAIVDQLLGTYMRASGSGYGVFVVCSSGPPHRWRGAGGTSLDFPSLVAHLSNYARKALDVASWAVDVALVDIDLH